MRKKMSISKSIEQLRNTALISFALFLILSYHIRLVEERASHAVTAIDWVILFFWIASFLVMAGAFGEMQTKRRKKIRSELEAIGKIVMSDAAANQSDLREAATMN